MSDLKWCAPSILVELEYLGNGERSNSDRPLPRIQILTETRILPWEEEPIIQRLEARQSQFIDCLEQAKVPAMLVANYDPYDVIGKVPVKFRFEDMPWPSPSTNAMIFWLDWMARISQSSGMIGSDFWAQSWPPEQLSRRHMKWQHPAPKVYKSQSW